VAVVDVCEHEEVGVARFIPHAVRPVLVVAQDAVDPRLVVASIVVGSREMLPVVFLRRVFVSSPWEVETEPCFDFVRFADFLGSI